MPKMSPAAAPVRMARQWPERRQPARTRMNAITAMTAAAGQ